jgi:DNA polymerase-4
MDTLVEELEQELRAKALDRQIYKAFVKVKFADFKRTTRECVSVQPTRETYRALLAEAWTRNPLPVRLLGSGVRFAEEADAFDDGQSWLDLELTN